MSAAAPPLRFLGIVLGGWVCARATVLAPDWATEEIKASEPPLPRALAPTPVLRKTLAPAPVTPAAPDVAAPRIPTPASVAAAPPASAEPQPKLALNFADGHLAVVPAASPEPPAITAFEAPLPVGQPIATAIRSTPGRLTVSGWAIVREGAEPRLAPGGLLGGSQAGARATYSLGRSLAVSGRVSSPFNGDGAEAALGIEWQPSPSIPVKLLAERRQALGEEGRSAFALVAHGGVSGVKVAGPVTAEAYAQAGVVGAKERDLFADGAVKLNVPVTPALDVGAGAWGAAQPDVSRLDVGPHVTLTLPGGGATVKVSAEWRVRVAGDAEPGSGPAVTVSTSF